MTILSEGPLCLRIHLSKYELKKYFNNYNAINIEDDKTRKTIIMLFNIAANMSNFETNGKRIVEIFPTTFGGCILKFTTNPLVFQHKKPKEAKNLKLKNNINKNSPYIFCFNTFENLLRVTFELYKSEKTRKYKSTLYFSNKKYFLKISIPVFDIKTSIFINEFCEYSTKGRFAESKLEEYSTLLIKSNAITVLNRYFLKV